MNKARELLRDVNRRTDAFVKRTGVSEPDTSDRTADGRFTLPGLIALLAVGVRDRPREPLVTEALSPAVIERALNEIGGMRGVPIRVDEARAVVELLTTGELVVDVVTGLRAVLVLVPRLPVAVARDVLTLPELPRDVVEAIRADLRDDAPRTLRDVIVDLHDGRLDSRRRILTNTLRVLLAEATPGALVETIAALIGPENQTVRLAVLVYARTQGIDLYEEDLDALHLALNPANPDLGVLLDRGLERVVDTYEDAALAVAVLHRITARAIGCVASDRMTRRRPASPRARASSRHKEKRHMADHGVRRRGLRLVLGVTLLLIGCGKDGARPGEVADEAKTAGRAAASFPAADEDYFRDMDGGGPLTREEVKGRNTWIVWTGGNDRFWDRISVSSFGVFDLLKMVSSHPDKTLEHFSRDNRWRYLGILAMAGLLGLPGGGAASAQSPPKGSGDGARGDTPGGAPIEIVVHVTDLPRSALEEFEFWSDPTSPGGRLVGTPNTGDELDPPPEDDPHVRFRVRVQPGIPYRCWIHMKVGAPKGKSQANLLYVQVTNAVDRAGREVFKPGTGSYLAAQGPTREGWTWVGCNSVKLPSPEPHILFRTAGEITVRVQAGMEGVGFDQFLLSPARFLDRPPSGAVVPKPAK